MLERNALCELGTALLQAQEWERADEVWNEVINLLPSGQEKGSMQKEYSKLLTQAQQWKRAIAVVQSIEGMEMREEASIDLSKALALAQQWDLAKQVAQSIKNIKLKVDALQVLFEAQQEDQAFAILDSTAALLRLNLPKVELSEIAGETMRQDHMQETAEQMMDSLAKSSKIFDRLNQQDKLLELVHQRRFYQKFPSSLEERWKKMVELRELGKKLSQRQQKEHSNAIWNAAIALAHSFPESEWKFKALRELGKDLTEAQELKRADKIWKEIIAMTHKLPHFMREERLTL